MSTNESGREHFNPLLVTVLPKERRARSPYQFMVMVCVFTLGIWQLTIGPVPISAVNLLDEAAYGMLNAVSVLAGLAGIAAAYIPERIIEFRIGRKPIVVDATYFRLWLEFGCHALLLVIWVIYTQVTWAGYGLIKGYSIAIAASLCLGTAAVWRIIQIWLTLYRAGTFSRKSTAIVGKEEIDTPPGTHDVQ